METLARYQGALSLLATLFLAAFLAVGFAFKTPAQKFMALEQEDRVLHRQDDVMIARQDSMQHEQREIVRMLRIVALDVCLRRSAQQTQMMQLPCRDLLNPRGTP